MLGRRYWTVVTTCLTTSHYHNHIVWISVEVENERRYRINAQSYVLEIPAMSDEQYEKYGLLTTQTERATPVLKPYAE